MHNLPFDWIRSKLGDSFVIDLGKMLSPEASFGFSMKPYLANRNVQWNRLELDDLGCMDFTESERRHFRLVKGDLLICEGGEIGRAAMWQGELEECYFQKAIHRLRPRGTRDPVTARFLLHYMKYAADHNLFRGLVSQSSIAHLTREKLALFPIIHPASTTEQQRITEILDSLDGQIGSSDRLISKLQSAHTGLMHALLANFGSDTQPLADYLSATPRNGFSPKEVEDPTGVLALGLGCLTVDGFSPRQLKNAPAVDHRYKDARLSDGDLLMSRSNTLEMVGLAGRYRNVGVPCIYPDLMMRLTPTPSVRPEFLEIVLRSAEVRAQIKCLAQGTSGSMVKISGASVSRLQVRIPDLPEQERILRISAASVAQITELRRERARLQTLKQGLMDDLLSGRVRVPA
jgi:type I restriction enzyme S subunit